MQSRTIHVKNRRGWQRTLTVVRRSGVALDMETDGEALVVDLFHGGLAHIIEELAPRGLIHALREPADDLPLNCG